MREEERIESECFSDEEKGQEKRYRRSQTRLHHLICPAKETALSANECTSLLNCALPPFGLVARQCSDPDRFCCTRNVVQEEEKNMIEDNVNVGPELFCFHLVSRRLSDQKRAGLLLH